MRNLLILMLGTTAIVLTSCHSKPGIIDAVSAAKSYSDNAAQAQKASEDKWAERKAKGDTLAIPYADLEAYLPDVSGYTKSGGATGSQMNMPGMGGGWSVAEQQYANGDKNVKVSIMDYNAAYQAFAGVTAVYKMGFTAEDDDKKQGPTDLGISDVVAYETVYKKNPQAEMAIIAGDRFIIQIQSQGSNDPALLSSIAKSMKLSELASK